MNTLSSRFLVWAALFGMLSVIIGAMGAHFLQKIMDAKALLHIETGAKYQMYHALALALVAVLHHFFPGKLLSRAAYCFILGIICFSFSLYVLAWLETYAPESKVTIAMITPLGGLLLITGWLFLLIAGFKLGRKSDLKS